MKTKKIFLYEILACNRRKLDMGKLYNYFIENNYEVVTNPIYADIIVLTTCSYSNKRKELALKAIKSFFKYDAEIIVTGCLPEIDKDELKKIFDGKTISTKELDDFDKFFPQNKVRFKDMNDVGFLWENKFSPIHKVKITNIFNKSHLIRNIIAKLKNHILLHLFREDENYCYNYATKYPYFEWLKRRVDSRLAFHRDTYIIRPCWGCLGTCSYCAIRKAIGRLKSKPLDVVMKDFRKGLDRGYKKFLFDADDLGAYGLDINSNFPELLDKITDIQGEYKLHVRYIHPQWIVNKINDFEQVLIKDKIDSIGCSIQSGNMRILKLMNRYSDIEKIKKVFLKIRNSFPNLQISTECINGFPTETFDEFKDTLHLIIDIDFDWGYIFPFSCKTGTPVEKLEPKVSDEEIKKRMNYAKKYFRNNGYDSTFFKDSDILVFKKQGSQIMF